ncbi:MAG: hypothetical protein ACOYLC_06295 [Armatimonadaceae bacterium]
MITDILAYTFVAWACYAIAIRVYKLFTKTSSCDGCSCSGTKSDNGLIKLELRISDRSTNKKPTGNIN